MNKYLFIWIFSSFVYVCAFDMLQVYIPNQVKISTDTTAETLATVTTGIYEDCMILFLTKLENERIIFIPQKMECFVNNHLNIFSFQSANTYGNDGFEGFVTKHVPLNYDQKQLVESRIKNPFLKLEQKIQYYNILQGSWVCCEKQTGTIIYEEIKKIRE